MAQVEATHHSAKATLLALSPETTHPENNVQSFEPGSIQSCPHTWHFALSSQLTGGSAYFQCLAVLDSQEWRYKERNLHCRNTHQLFIVLNCEYYVRLPLKDFYLCTKYIYMKFAIDLFLMSNSFWIQYCGIVMCIICTNIIITLFLNIHLQLHGAF